MPCRACASLICCWRWTPGPASRDASNAAPSRVASPTRRWNATCGTAPCSVRGTPRPRTKSSRSIRPSRLRAAGEREAVRNQASRLAAVATPASTNFSSATSQQGRHSLRVAHRWCDWQCPVDHGVKKRQLIRFQRARRIAQAHQYQCEAKLVGFPTALRDKRQIFGSECRMAENLSLVRGKTKQPRPCRLASNLCLAITRPPCVGAWLV